MADQNVRIEGLNSLNQNLRELADTYGPRNAAVALNAPIRETLRPIAERIEAETPEDTGQLADSTRVRVNKATGKLKRSKYVENNADVVGQVGWAWETKSLWRRALAIEFGTRELPPQRILNDKLPDLVTGVQEEFIPALRRSIEATATRLARRQARGNFRRR